MGNMNFRPLRMRFSRFPWHHHVESQIRHAPIVMRDQTNQQDWEPSPMPKRRLNTQSRDYSSARSRAVPLRIASKVEFWTVGSVWKRASVNTLRCLVGCTTGDFSTLWYLQAYHPGFAMVAMELVENLIDYNLTGGIVALHDLRFWTAAVLSATGGFLAPLPYNYFKLRRFGKSCH